MGAQMKVGIYPIARPWGSPFERILFTLLRVATCLSVRTNRLDGRRYRAENFYSGVSLDEYPNRIDAVVVWLKGVPV